MLVGGTRVDENVPSISAENVGQQKFDLWPLGNFTVSGLMVLLVLLLVGFLSFGYFVSLKSGGNSVLGAQMGARMNILPGMARQ